MSLLEALHNQELPPTKAIGEMCAKVLTSLNDVSKKTQVLDDVSRNLMGISRDLETTILFASAGTLNSDENTMTRNSGIFWVMIMTSSLIGNTYIYFQFQGLVDIDKKTRTMVKKNK